MYYLYKKKVNTDDRRASETNTPPVSVQSSTGSVSSSSKRRHYGGQDHLHQHAPQHSGYPLPIAEEGSNNLNIPEGPLDPSSQQTHRISRGPEPEDQESKQKDDQMVRRMLRRRGLEEEYDQTSDILRPMRPSRVSCLRCTQDISYNHHRVTCTSEQEKHSFCRNCVVRYVDAWVKGETEYELRQGGRQGRSRALFALPCISPACQFGCFPEASLQPLLTHAMFTGCRQKLVRARAEYSQSMSLQQDAGSSCSSESYAMAQRRGQDTEQGAQPPPRQAQSQPLYSQLTGQPIHTGGPINPVEVAQLQRRRREPPDYEQYQRHYHQQQPQLQERTPQQLQEGEDELEKQQLRQQHLIHYNEYMHEQHQRQQQQQQQQQQQDTNQQRTMTLPQTILRRTSTASTGNTSRNIHQRVRFSVNSSEDMAVLGDDGGSSVASSGSSATSLTTRFPMSVDSQAQETEGEANKQLDLQQQHGPQEEPRSQHLEQHQAPCPSTQKEAVDVALTTCQCCYEEFSAKTSPVICCEPLAHRFCSKCVRTYVEEWIFGAATYQPRPGRPDSQGQSLLMLPCLYGDCSEGGFPDEQVSQLLTQRSMEQYRSKIYPLRIQKEDDEERLVQMAIQLSLEHEQSEKRVTELYQEQASFTQGGLYIYPPNPAPRDMRPPSTLSIRYTTLSNTSSLTSFSTFPRSTRSLTDIPRGGLIMNNLTSNGDLDQQQKGAKGPPSANLQDSIRDKCLHSVEEAMTLAKVRTCPQCMTKFLKDEDFCNKLKCPSCKTAICYVCRNIIPNQGYEHFCIHQQGGCVACQGTYCPLWTQVDDDNRRDTAEIRARGLDEANRIWEESLLLEHSRGIEICVDVDSLLQQPPASQG
jgi:hypothetical protein